MGVILDPSKLKQWKVAVVIYCFFYIRWVWLSHCLSQVKSSGVSVAPSYRPYLLALLTHQSNWSTLHQCISSLLNKQREQRWAALSNTLRSFCFRTFCMCNCVSSDLQTGPNLSSGLPVGLQSHSPHLAGARSENSSGLITVNITSQLWIYLHYQHLFSSLARLLVVSLDNHNRDRFPTVLKQLGM